MKDRIIDILCKVAEVERSELEGDMELFENGILDSFGVIMLLVEIEEEIGLIIEPTEVERSMIDTPDKLAAYVMGKISADKSKEG